MIETRSRRVAGRTELDIIAESLRMTESLRVNGIEPTDEAVRKLSAAPARGYEDAREELTATGRALPGTRETTTPTGRSL